MLPAVDLDDQHACRYGEIRNVPSNRMLTSDFDREFQFPQRTPQNLFGVCGVRP